MDKMAIYNQHPLIIGVDSMTMVPRCYRVQKLFAKFNEFYGMRLHLISAKLLIIKKMITIIQKQMIRKDEAIRTKGKSSDVSKSSFQMPFCSVHEDN